MLRPLWVDLALTLIPLTLAGTAWVAGRYAARMPRKAVLALLCLVLPLVPLPLLRLAPGCQESADLLLYRMGGTTRLECAIALFLLGFAWATPRKSLSPAFRALTQVHRLASCPSRKRGAQNAGAHGPGAVGQHSGFGQTAEPLSVPASAWHGSTLRQCWWRHVFNVVEHPRNLETVPYLSNRLLLGASALDMADALRLKLKGTGFRPVVRHLHYDQLLGKDQPFVACVELPGLGGHALLVFQLFDTGILMVDPQSGAQNRMSRADLSRSGREPS